MKHAMGLSLVLLVAGSGALAFGPVEPALHLLYETPVLAPPVGETAVDLACACRDSCFSDLQCALFVAPGSTCEPTGPCGCKECTSVEVSAVAAEDVEASSGVCEQETGPAADLDLRACGGCRPECFRDRDCRFRYGKGSTCIIDPHCGCNTCSVLF